MNKKKIFINGIKDGIPIALGYYAVAFSLGIIAKKGGLNAISGFVTSFFTRASAGEYGAYTLISENATYVELALMCMITNLRYLLMSTALTQKFNPKTGLLTRIFLGTCITDEIFGISIAYKGYLEPLYTFGAALISTFGWASGTACGIIAGSILPGRYVSALSVALYGMFLAIIIPPAKKDKAVCLSVIASFILSYACTLIPYIKALSAGTRTIILTILISAIVAFIKPVDNKNDKVKEGVAND